MMDFVSMDPDIIVFDAEKPLYYPLSRKEFLSDSVLRAFSKGMSVIFIIMYSSSIVLAYYTPNINSK